MTELGVLVERGREVTGFTQDDAGVDVRLVDGRDIRAQFLVGCDGGRSLIRKTAGIDFPGWDPTISHLIAEVQVTEDPPWGLQRDDNGIHSLIKTDTGSVRVMVTERGEGANTEPTLRDLSDELVAVYGSDFGIHSPVWISRFTDATRQATSYRTGRVLLAGDAAWDLPAIGPIHPPAAVLVRPDGYVAWVGDGTDLGLADALTKWFGAGVPTTSEESV